MKAPLAPLATGVCERWPWLVLQPSQPRPPWPLLTRCGHVEHGVHVPFWASIHLEEAKTFSKSQKVIVRQLTGMRETREAHAHGSQAGHFLQGKCQRVTHRTRNRGLETKGKTPQRFQQWREIQILKTLRVFFFLPNLQHFFFSFFLIFPFNKTLISARISDRQSHSSPVRVEIDTESQEESLRL